MGTWGSYQSLIQLGVALGLGYAFLETLLRDQVSSYEASRIRLLGRLSDPGAISKISALQQSRAKRVGKAATWLHVRFARRGVYFGTILGIIDIFLLCVASEMPNARLAGVERILVLATTIGWFVVLGSVGLVMRGLVTWANAVIERSSRP